MYGIGMVALLAALRGRNDAHVRHIYAAMMYVSPLLLTLGDNGWAAPRGVNACHTTEKKTVAATAPPAHVQQPYHGHLIRHVEKSDGTMPAPSRRSNDTLSVSFVFPGAFGVLGRQHSSRSIMLFFQVLLL